MAYVLITKKRKQPKTLHSTAIWEVTFHINIYVKPLSNMKKGIHSKIIFLISRFRRKTLEEKTPLFIFNLLLSCLQNS